jgi:peptidoglycan-associated lipoprotein
MIRNKLATIVAVVVTIVAAGPLAAQKYRMDLGVNGGSSWYSAALSAADIGSSSSTGSIKFGPNWLLGAQTTVWLPRMLFVPRVGVRANFSYTDTDLEQTLASSGKTLLHGDINLWSGTGDLVLGMKSPEETWAGPEFLPFLALGGGLKWVNPAGNDARLTNSDGDEFSGLPITCLNGACTAATSNPPGGTGTGQIAGRRSFFLSSERTPMLLAGLGGDVRFAPNFALRLEAGDRMWKAPIRTTAPPTAEFPNVPTVDNSRAGKLVHEVYVQAGLQMLVGLTRPAVLAIVAVPAPTAPPRVEIVAPQTPAFTWPMVKTESDDAAAQARTEQRRREEADRVRHVLNERVLFAYDKSELTDNAKRTLDAKVVILKTNPDVRLMIEGYADERGTTLYNDALGLRRANALRDYLSAAGLLVTRLAVISYGKTRPLSAGTSEADYALNRRGEFLVLGELVQTQLQR